MPGRRVTLTDLAVQAEEGRAGGSDEAREDLFDTRQVDVQASFDLQLKVDLLAPLLVEEGLFDIRVDRLAGAARFKLAVDVPRDDVGKDVSRRAATGAALGDGHPVVLPFRDGLRVRAEGTRELRSRQRV